MPEPNASTVVLLDTSVALEPLQVQSKCASDSANDVLAQVASDQSVMVPAYSQYGDILGYHQIDIL